MESNTLICDGCAQPTDLAHIARRLKRLEARTRYRPVHIQTMFLSAAVPADDHEQLYSADGEFAGEGAAALGAVGLQQIGSIEQTLTAFQRGGYFLTHLLDCYVEGSAARKQALELRLPATLARIRRSYKPKRVVLVGGELAPLVTQITAADLGAVIVLDKDRPYEWAALNPTLLADLAAEARASAV